jgi:hypothetical protein
VELTDEELRALVVQARRLRARKQQGSWALSEEQLKEIDEMMEKQDWSGKKDKGASVAETDDREGEQESPDAEKVAASEEATGIQDVDQRRATDKLTRVAGMKIRRAKLRAINRGSMKVCMRAES